MKTVCKKLFSLMLVAVLLVSAVPFQAFATEGGNVNFYIRLWVGEECKVNAPVSVPVGTTMDLAAIQAYATQYLNGGEYFGAGYEMVGAPETQVATENNQGAEVFFKVVEAPVPPVTEPPVTEPPVTEPPVTEAPTYALNFVNEYDTDRAISLHDGDVIDAPNAKDVYGYVFRGWYTGRNGTGTRIYDNETVWHVGNATTYYAYYTEQVSSVSRLRVYLRRYVNGVAQGADIQLYEKDFDNGDDLYKWLYDSRDSIIATKVFETVSANEYQWKDRFFYNYWSNEAMTAADLKADGSKDIFIKVDSLKSNQANVMLYLHKNTDSEAFRILSMTGYTAGNSVTRAAAIDKIDDYYSYGSISNLYTEEDWAELQAGKNMNGRSSVILEHNGTTIIHLVVKNASSKSGAVADSSNPKTGDSITIAATTMILAAVALVSMVELKKRKMI